MQSQISPHYQAALLHVQFVQVSCVRLCRGWRRGGQCFSCPAPSLVTGAGSQGTFLNKAAQPSPAPCSNIPAFRTALVRPKQQGPIPHPCCFACDISH